MKIAFVIFFKMFLLQIVIASPEHMENCPNCREFMNLFFTRLSKLDFEIRRKKKKIISFKFEFEITISDPVFSGCLLKWAKQDEKWDQNEAFFGNFTLWRPFWANKCWFLAKTWLHLCPGWIIHVTYMLRKCAAKKKMLIHM